MRTVAWVSCLIVEASALLGGRFRCFEVGFVLAVPL